jgi:hypothetical protein
MIEAALIFHLGDDARCRPTDYRTDRVNMGGALDEADSDVIDAVLFGERQHRAIMIGHKVAAKRHLGNVDALAAS